MNPDGQYRIHTSQSQMIEQAIPLTIAVVTGGAVMINRVHNKIHSKIDALTMLNCVWQKRMYLRVTLIEPLQEWKTI